MDVIPIDRLDDPRIAGYAAVRERDLVGRDGLFVAEGEVVLRVLLGRSAYAVRSLLVSERRVDAMAALLGDRAPAPPVYALAQALMDQLVGFPIHRGLLALGDRGAPRTGDALLDGLGPAATVVGIVGVCNHDNVGGIFRNAAAFGADAVLLDATSCDPLYRKAIRVSVGGALVVPFARVASAAAMLDALAARGFDTIALAPRGDERIDTLAPGPRRALLLGAEGPGLPDEILRRCRRTRIDIVDAFDSLNVAVTSGIALHALRARDR